MNLKTLLTVSAVAVLSFSQSFAADIKLLNVSYDPTRELYEEYNQAFAKHWKEKTGDDVTVKQSHGGSGKQARSVIEGLPADVVTLALAYDIDAIAEHAALLPKDWQTKLPHNSAPYTSTIVFLVKKGNPKNIKDWGDLVQDGVEVITPNPKTSGGARWNFLAAYGYALQANGNDEVKAAAYMKKLFEHVPVLDAGARGATMNFVQRQIGDVLITWENEAFLAKKEHGGDNYEIVVPSLSIKAEPPVAVVEANAEKHHTTAAATEYVTYLFSPEAQELAAKHFYRPSDELVAKKYADIFPIVAMKTIDDFGGWKVAQAKFFADGGVFDQIYTVK
jgi:sulfate/thiosulfate-binding protein